MPETAADSPLVFNSAVWSPRYGGFSLGPLDIRAPKGRFIAVAGPNGAGKTTLLRIAAGLLTPDAGEARLYGRPQREWRGRARGRVTAYLSQEPERPFGFTVLDYVGLGRFPHIGPFRSASREDRTIIRREIRAWGLENLADRPVNTLSGGEFQRTRLARALSQNPGLLLLDEPGNHLDLSSRIGILRRLKEEAAGGRTVLAVIHDVNDALLYADETWLMRRGCIIASGAPAEVLTPERLATVYGISLTPFTAADGRVMLGVSGEGQ